MRLTIVLLRSLISQRWARTLVGSPGWAPGHSLYRLKRADSARQKMWAGLSSSSSASSQVDLHTEDRKNVTPEKSWKCSLVCFFHFFSFFSCTLLNTHSPPLSVAFCHTHTPPLSSFLSLCVTRTLAFSPCHTPTPTHTCTLWLIWQCVKKHFFQPFHFSVANYSVVYPGFYLLSKSSSSSYRNLKIKPTPLV